MTSPVAAGQAAPAAPRPVTPMGLIVQALDDLVARIDGGAWDDRAVALLRETHRLAAGLDPYVERHTTPESPALRDVARATARHDWGAHNGAAGVFLEQEMLSGHVEGQFLKMLVHATRARSILEIGLFTGYSALAMAEALPADGRLVALEVDPDVARMAADGFRASPAGSRIDIRVAPAAETLEALAAAGETFDLVFLDADKGGYLDSLTAVLDRDLLAPGGLICVDNTLMQGQPWASDDPPPNGAAIAAFNDAVTADPRVEQVLVPLRDGITLIRRADRP